MTTLLPKQAMACIWLQKATEKGHADAQSSLSEVKYRLAEAEKKAEARRAKAEAEAQEAARPKCKKCGKNIDILPAAKWGVPFGYCSRDCAMRDGHGNFQ